MSCENKPIEVRSRAMHLAQSTISISLTERQVTNKTSKGIYVTREVPEQLAVGIALHQASRCKEIINFLHGFGLSVKYNRLLRVETEIKKKIIEKIQLERSLYIPSEIILGRFIFFAIDNTDFEEDTPDGKHTLHGAAMTIYQQVEPDDEEPSLR